MLSAAWIYGPLFTVLECVLCVGLLATLVLIISTGR